MQEALSTFDIKILEQLQKDCTVSTVELAEIVGLSQSPCWRRLQRLKDEGLIKQQVAILDREKLGIGLVIFAQVKVEKLSKLERDKFHRKVNSTPEIAECYSVFGEMDLIMKIQAKSMAWYQSFVMNELMHLPGVQNVNSLSTLEEIKCSTAVPVRGIRAL